LKKLKTYNTSTRTPVRELDQNTGPEYWTENKNFNNSWLSQFWDIFK